MVDVVNSVNNNMTVNKPHIGVLTPPGTQAKMSNIYSDVDATRRYKEITKDLAYADRKVEYGTKKKTWIGVLTCSGIVAAAVILMQKNVFAKIKNFNIKNIFNVFKRKP